MSSNHNPNTIFLTPEEAERIRTTLKTRLQKCQELAGQPRIPPDPQARLNQVATASLLSDITPHSARPDAMVAIPIPPPFPPCILSIQDLAPMKMNELRMATHHRGRMLKIRRISDVVKLMTCSWTIVQDESGEMERLEIGLHKERHGGEVLEGETFVVKEPWFTLAEGEEGVVRVEHPSDLVCVDDNPDSKFVTKEETEGDGAVEKTARELKEKGNVALKQRVLPLAHAHYTCGLKMVTTFGTAKGNSDLTYDLFRNRAYLNLLLHCYDQAKADALSSLTNQPDQRHRELDGKAYARAAHAAYALGEFHDAKRFFEEQRRLAPADKDASAWMRKIEVRLKEQENGAYDFKKLKAGLMLLKANPRIDAASFTSIVEVRESPGRGRGLFTTRNIEPGAVIMVEKAFCVVWGIEDKALTALTYENRDDRIRVFPAGLCKAVVQQLLNNTSQLGKSMDLYGDYAGIGKQLTVRDDSPVIDTFQVYDIVARNAFGTGTAHGDENARNASTGLWITASYINHSCVANSKKEYIGDLMVLRATRAVFADEEITHSYVESSDFDARREALMKGWNFTCSCALCVAEKEDGTALRKKRLELEKEASALVEREDAIGAKRISILKARRLAKSISDTYDDERYSDLPRMALLRIQKWLAETTTP